MTKVKKTVKDYTKLQERALYQLIEGGLVINITPDIEHQRSLKRLLRKLFDAVEISGKGEVFCAPVEVYLDEHNVCQPDLVVVLKGGKANIDRERIAGPPDVVVEILFPPTGYYDMIEKKEVYERVGVREYWMVDPYRNSFEVYSNSGQGFKLASQATQEGKVKSELLGLEIELREVFSQ